MKQRQSTGQLRLDSIEVGDHLIIDATFELFDDGNDVEITDVYAEIYLRTESLKQDLKLIDLSSDDIIKEFGEFINKAYEKEDHRVKWKDYEHVEEHDE